MRFDGKKLAGKIEEELKMEVKGLKKKPVLLIILANNSKASADYVARKKEMGERIGIEVRVVKVDGSRVAAEIEKGNQDKGIDGVMVQLPVEGFAGEKLEELLLRIDLKKDVDGLNPKCMELMREGGDCFVPAAVKAIGKILDEALREVDLDILKMRVAIVGSQGAVGRGVVAQMKRFGVEPVELEVGDDLGKLKEMDVVISATGKEGLIEPEMVRGGVIAIDVGYPKGDFEKSVEEKAAFITPVPGGVGPMTVVCLMENMVRAANTR